jgi:transposase-like protein
MTAINEHLNLHGPQNWDELMAKFPTVSRATFFRWIREAKEKMEGAAAKQGNAALQITQRRIRSQVEIAPERVQREIKAQLPAAPSPAVIASNSSELVRETFNFMAFFHDIVGDAAMVREAAVTRNEDGTVRLKNPHLMDKSLQRRLSIIETYLHSIETIYNVERMQELYHLIIEEVGKVSPELQRVILVKLRELNNRRGLTMSARLG